MEIPGDQPGIFAARRDKRTKMLQNDDSGRLETGADSRIYRSHSPQHDDPEHGPRYNGRPVIDEHGARLGTITDVVFDLRGNDPEYLVVDPVRAQELDAVYINSTAPDLCLEYGGRKRQYKRQKDRVAHSVTQSSEPPCQCV